MGDISGKILNKNAFLGSRRTHCFRLCSDFLVPDYLSQVQEEEEALGVQYELEESQHPSAFPGGCATSSAAAAPLASSSSSSSSSVHLPVIAQVSSSTQNCENFTDFRSPEPLDPLEVQGSPKADVAAQAKTDNGGGASSPDEERRRRQLASITAE